MTPVYYKTHWVSIDKMGKGGKKLPTDFESSEVCNLLGIKPFYLNKFIERRQYGINPSVGRKRGRGSRRRFSWDDLIAVALVWWLFESGLRSDVIGRVLRDLGNSIRADATLAAKKTLESPDLLLVVMRELESPQRQMQKFPPQEVFVMDTTWVAQKVRTELNASLQIIPVGKLFSRLMERIRSYQEADWRE